MGQSPQHAWTTGDPKFWPAWLRYAILANLCVFVFTGNMYSAGVSTGFIELAQDLHVSFPKLADLISWSVFALGISNLFWMPTALCIGKRPVILISMLIFLVGAIWSAKAQDYKSLMGSRILASFGAGSVEALGPSIIADMFFERYFATAMALFTLSLSGGSQVGPMIAGFLIQSCGWRWFFILCTIIIGANLVGSLLLLPETTFRRVIYGGETAAEVGKHVVEMIEHESNGMDVSQTAPNSQDCDLQRSHYTGNYFQDLFHFTDRAQEPRGLVAWPRQLTLPFRFIFIPSVLFATGSYGLMLAGIVVISILSSQLLAPPPYLFSSSDIGLYSLASYIGVVLAYPIAGPLTDLLSKVMRHRNNGIHEPEHRMPALIFPFLIAPPGLILFAYTMSHGKSYYASAVGYSMQATGLVFVPSVVLSYVVDAYPESGGEALVLINAGKNLIAFGVTLSCNDWLAREGLIKMLWELAAAQWSILVFSVPLYFAGPWLRRHQKMYREARRTGVNARICSAQHPLSLDDLLQLFFTSSPVRYREQVSGAMQAASVGDSE
ncbi:hypothetical protein OIDMADRAFT_23845 [Oidiodendron maius Zn]|uniref:Major facilitator superfamily (MFS) profile domain-containing protein n=1 Tax=Oidiodendron maius (strain Zn) TaxID=913774 RepID=A0A0C3DCS6_OIDMZ|nr:hypothetical protein OIDMADRAFT_23845 [Oidiodendron maius Zn]